FIERSTGRPHQLFARVNRLPPVPSPAVNGLMPASPTASPARQTPSTSTMNAHPVMSRDSLTPFPPRQPVIRFNNGTAGSDPLAPRPQDEDLEGGSMPANAQVLSHALDRRSRQISVSGPPVGPPRRLPSSNR